MVLLEGQTAVIKKYIAALLQPFPVVPLSNEVEKDKQFIINGEERFYYKRDLAKCKDNESESEIFMT